MTYIEWNASQNASNFGGVFRFSSAEVGRTKLKLMSLCTASREVLIDISFAIF